MRVSFLVTTILMAFVVVSPGNDLSVEDFRQWSLGKAVDILNDSPWARNETYTRVVRGVGSGVSGEKEIYNTFYVRFLSARPIREAYARIQQIQYGYDGMDSEQKQKFEMLQQPNLDLDVQDWIVVCVAFRSNDPNEESSVRRFFLSQTAETLRTKAFLSTPEFSQVEILEYFPPIEDSVGAKFIFPRKIDGMPIVSDEGGLLAFELLEVPGAEPRLRAAFVIEEMLQEGNLIL